MYTVVRDETDYYCVIECESGKQISPMFLTESAAWHWLDKQED